MAKPYTEMGLLEFSARFPDEHSCWDYLGKMRWPEGFECSKCKNDTSCFLSQRKVFQCNKCKKQQSATAGTIFHKSRVSLQKWFWCIYFMATSKKGTPILYLQGVPGEFVIKLRWVAEKDPYSGFANGSYPT